MSQKTWGGRFSSVTDSRVERFSESISFDYRLLPFDIRASQAHAQMLAEVGLLTPAEGEQICQALDQVQADLEAGKIPFQASLEDIHTHVETALIARIGDLGRKLHTGRSRNDQVVTDVKLWTRHAIDQIDAGLLQLQRAYVDLAQRSLDVIIPGYTHLQRAQPILAAHWCLCYVEKFQRDRERLADCRKRVNILSLGAAALAGTSLPIDRHRVAEKLGFSEVARNSLDVSSDRDFLAEYLFCLALMGVHLSNWAEEWVLWSTTEFNTIELPDEFCTGSSIMPHKKNPDVLELTRGRSAKTLAALQQVLVLLKGLPTAYNRDLQEDKPPLFEATDTILGILEVAPPLILGARFKTESINARLEDGFLDATTLMEGLIARGIPMRSAHEMIGKLVQECETKRCRLIDLPVSRLEEICPNQGQELRELLGVKKAIETFKSYGSTAPNQVRSQLEMWQKKLQANPQR